MLSLIGIFSLSPKAEGALMNQAFTESPRPAAWHSRLKVRSKHRLSEPLLALGENHKSQFMRKHRSV
jgi:hypothetical protein